MFLRPSFMRSYAGLNFSNWQLVGGVGWPEVGATVVHRSKLNGSCQFGNARRSKFGASWGHTHWHTCTI